MLEISACRSVLIAIFLFAGALAAIAGGLFASLQTYITPDAFTFDLSVLFFIAILIGGRGSILGPMLATWGEPTITRADLDAHILAKGGKVEVFDPATMFG